MRYTDCWPRKALAAESSSYDLTNRHEPCRGIWDIVSDSRIINVISDLLGDRVIMHRSQLFIPFAGDAKRISRHHGVAKTLS